MGTKMKGILKGLRYISHIFDAEEKEQEMQIGLPTDVKHVAHIGWDGPAVDSPSWMDKFEPPGGGPQSGALSIPDDNRSEDSSSRRGSRSVNTQEVTGTKTTRRRGSTDGSDSPKKEKSRQSRRHSKDSSDNNNIIKSNSNVQQLIDGSVAGPASPARDRDLPDIPKRSRRKKSGGASVSSKLKGTTSNTGNSSFSDFGVDTGSPIRSTAKSSRTKHQEKENRGFS